MTCYHFTLSFELPDPSTDPIELLDALYRAGCDDTTPGILRPGLLALAFGREASSAGAAVTSAIQQVHRAVPRAKLVEIVPIW